jgi:hypothetical protein
MKATVSEASPLAYFLLSLCFFLSHVSADEQVDYLKQIKPIFREQCYACHGALKQEGNLRLDTALLAIRGGDSGNAITPGDEKASLLLKRVTAADKSDRMPPEHEGEPLTAERIELLRRWISAGAVAPATEEPEPDPIKHWAFQKIARPAIPDMKTPWIRNPIDAFLHEQHLRLGIVPQSEAPRLILLRRLHLDIIGIPPTFEEIAACEADESTDWYERTASRLLDDPRHGERWARHWMDIWRYSDWWGLGAQLRNSQKHIWHWRDWIVESLNADTPYDEMVRLMLAADELHPNDLSKLRATGYLARNYWLFNRPQWMEETVEHVSKGFLGITMNCARCHDHKYDPLEQTDYYKLRAFFEPYHVRTDIIPGEANLANDGIPRVFDGQLEEPTYLYIRGDERNPDKSQTITPGVPARLAFDELEIKSIQLPAESWQPERRPWVLDAYISDARNSVEQAASQLKKLQADLIASRSTPLTDLSSAESHDSADHASEEMKQAELGVAEAAFAMAQAEWESVVQRAEAMRAEWSPTDSPVQDKTKSAIRAERMANIAKLRHSVAVAQRAIIEAERDTQLGTEAPKGKKETNDKSKKDPADKKAAADKKLTSAREALGKAIKANDADITATDKFTRLQGATWTPTRFFNSGKDDPSVEFKPTSTGRRTALSNWITDPRNPLTARVAVNHLWTRHMGQPLVPTVFDFGRKGTRPTHPELLDWLACELIDSSWSMKHVHSLIVNSSVYRMSSSTNSRSDAISADPENLYWWRRVPIRLESQLVRDSMLALAGTIDFKMGGPSIPSQQQAESHRRSLYFFHSNNERSLFLSMFDEALVKDCYRREQSIVPQQALALANSRLVLDASSQISKRLSEKAVDDDDFTRSAFRFVVGFDASDEELDACRIALDQWRNQPSGSTENGRANLVWALINHNDFVTLR